MNHDCINFCSLRWFINVNRPFRIIYDRCSSTVVTGTSTGASTPALGESTDRQTELEIILQHSIPLGSILPPRGRASSFTEVRWFQKKRPSQHTQQQGN